MNKNNIEYQKYRLLIASRKKLGASPESKTKTGKIYPFLIKINEIYVIGAKNKTNPKIPTSLKMHKYVL